MITAMQILNIKYGCYLDNFKLKESLIKSLIQSSLILIFRILYLRNCADLPISGGFDLNQLL